MPGLYYCWLQVMASIDALASTMLPCIVDQPAVPIAQFKLTYIAYNHTVYYSTGRKVPASSIGMTSHNKPYAT